MSHNRPINQPDLTAPTPQNTPLTHAPIAQGLSRPTVPDITEEQEAETEDVAGALQTGAVQTALAGVVQSRLNSLVGKSSGYIEGLPVEVKRSLAALHGVQVKQNELQQKFKHELWELERKYLGLQKPLYERRHAIIQGTQPPTPEEIEAGEAAALKEDPEHTPLPKDEGTPQTAPITEFWLTSLRNHIGISELITDRDAAALKSLVDIQLSYLPADSEKPGFKLSFVFTPNEFFENTVLEKTYVYQSEIDYSGDFMYDRAIGTEIKWKEDKDLTKEFEIKKQRNKNTNRTRLVRKAHPTESFFNFFSPPEPPSEEAVENGDIDDDELEDLESRLELDYQIGEDIKERIIPRAVDYFTGKALEYDAEDDDEEFEDDDEEDNDEEDPFEDEESESEEEVPARRRGPPKRGAAANQNVNPEECKQQ